MTFSQREEGRVTGLSFRTDAGTATTGAGSEGSSTARLVSTGLTGALVIWNLDKKRLDSVMRGAHEGQILSAAFLPREPLLLTCGDDNSLKLWIFDQPDGSGRLLKSRQGHYAPPTRVKFYGGTTLATLGDGAEGAALQVVTAGQDQALRSFHVILDAQARELSQGKLAAQARRLERGNAGAVGATRAQDLKLSAISDFDMSETRGRDWCDIISCHEREPRAHVWSFEKRR